MKTFPVVTPANQDNTKTGQNGYRGASSDTDLSNPTKSKLSQQMPPVVIDKSAEKQKRDINGSDAGKSFAKPADTYGMTRLRPDSTKV
jgi:hypothetical protein